MRIWLNPEKLAAMNMTPQEVIGSLNEQNLQVAANVRRQPSLVPKVSNTVLPNSRINTREQFENIIVRTRPADASVVYLKDVAQILGLECCTIESKSDTANDIAGGYSNTYP